LDREKVHVSPEALGARFDRCAGEARFDHLVVILDFQGSEAHVADMKRHCRILLATLAADQAFDPVGAHGGGLRHRHAVLTAQTSGSGSTRRVISGRSPQRGHRGFLATLISRNRVSTATLGLRARILALAEPTLGRPMSGVWWMIWRWRLERSTASLSIRPIMPTPAAAK